VLEKYLRCLSGILLALMIAVIPIVVVHKMGFMDGPPLSPRKIVVMVAIHKTHLVDHHNWNDCDHQCEQDSRQTSQIFFQHIELLCLPDNVTIPWSKREFNPGTKIILRLWVVEAVTQVFCPML
jgi:hypothetical protein